MTEFDEKIFIELDGYINAAALYEDDGYEAGKKAFKEFAAECRRYGGADGQKAISAILEFENSNPSNRRKLYREFWLCQKQFSGVGQEDYRRPQTGKKKGGQPGRDITKDLDFLESKEMKYLDGFVDSHQYDEPFHEAVIRIMIEKNLTNPQVYKAACLSRQDFFRLIDPDTKTIKRNNVWSLVIGLGLDMEGAAALFKSAGYIIQNTKTDVLLTFCLEHGIYDVVRINFMLAHYGLPQLQESYVSGRGGNKD